MYYLNMLTCFILPVSTGVFFGMLVSAIIFLPQNQIFKTRRIGHLKFIGTIIFVTLLSLFVYMKSAISQKTLASISLSAMFSFFLRIWRIKSDKFFSKMRHNFMTFIDFIIFFSTLEFLILWLYALFTKGLLSAEHMFGFPFFYVLNFTYAIYNLNSENPGKVNLAVWRFSAYAFPENNIHIKGNFGASVENKLSFVEILQWIVIFLLIIIDFFFGYWISGHFYFTLIIFAFVIVLFFIFLPRNRFFHRESGLLKDLLESLYGSGIVVIFDCIVIFVLCIFGHFSLVDPQLRYFFALGIVAPIIFLCIWVLPSIFKLSGQFFTKAQENDQTYTVIKEVSNYILTAAFDKKHIKVLQAILIAAIFVCYVLIPRSISVRLSESQV